MHPNSRAKNQAGFSIIEMLIATTVMLIISAAIVTLMKSSMSVATSTYEVTDAQENLRIAHEFISRDLISAGDGLKSIPPPSVAEGFVKKYMTTDPIDAVAGGVPLGILTSDNSVPVGTTVLGPNGVATDPVVTVRSTPVRTDRQTILEIDSNFIPISLAPGKIKSDGTEITILDGDYDRFTAGEVYFLTSSRGGTFGTLTSKVDDGISPSTPNSILKFDTGSADKLGINVSGTSPVNGFKTISNSGALATSLQRMKIIHYYIDDAGRLMRRIFGVKGAGFRESAIAEHIVSVQFLYSLGPDDAGAVRQPVPHLDDRSQQIAVRQVEVTITAETPHTLARGLSPQLSSVQTTSVRNMQFREALQPAALP